MLSQLRVMAGLGEQVECKTFLDTTSTATTLFRVAARDVDVNKARQLSLLIVPNVRLRLFEPTPCSPHLLLPTSVDHASNVRNRHTSFSNVCSYALVGITPAYSQITILRTPGGGI